MVDGHRRAEGLLTEACRGEQRVLLGVHADADVVRAAAQAVVVAPRAAVAAALGAVGHAERRAVVPGAEHARVAGDHRADAASEAVGARARGERDQQEVLILAGPEWCRGGQGFRPRNAASRSIAGASSRDRFRSVRTASLREAGPRAAFARERSAPSARSSGRSARLPDRPGEVPPVDEQLVDAHVHDGRARLLAQHRGVDRAVEEPGGEEGVVHAVHRSRGIPAAGSSPRRSTARSSGVTRARRARRVRDTGEDDVAVGDVVQQLADVPVGAGVGAVHWSG